VAVPSFAVIWWLAIRVAEMVRVFDGVHGAVGANDELFRVENAVASSVPVLAPMMTLRPETRVGLSPDYTFKHLPLGARDLAFVAAGCRRCRASCASRLPQPRGAIGSGSA
jgi:hypothetical protein